MQSENAGIARIPAETGLSNVSTPIHYLNMNGFSVDKKYIFLKSRNLNYFFFLTKLNAFPKMSEFLLNRLKNCLSYSSHQGIEMSMDSYLVSPSSFSCCGPGERGTIRKRAFFGERPNKRVYHDRLC